MCRPTGLGVALGTIWAVVAIAVYLAMKKGILPPPKSVGLIDIILAALYAPFVGAIGLEALARRASPSFGELVLLTLVMATLVVLALVHAGRRLAHAVRRRTHVDPNRT